MINSRGKKNVNSFNIFTMFLNKRQFFLIRMYAFISSIFIYLYKSTNYLKEEKNSKNCEICFLSFNLFYDFIVAIVSKLEEQKLYI